MGFHTHDAVSGRLGRVLVVADEPRIRRLVHLTLTKAGYEVVEAQDGEHAIQVLNSGDNLLKVDTILCDIRMPKVNGIEAIAYFRTRYPTVSVWPLIAISTRWETLPVTLHRLGAGRAREAKPCGVPAGSKRIVSRGF